MLTTESIQLLQQAQSIQAAEQAVSKAAHAIVPLPETFKLHDLEKLLPARRRARATMSTAALASFALYAKTHAEQGAAVFIDQAKMNAMAVLNLGGPQAPGHGDNTAVFSPERTAAYSALLATANGGPLKQTAAAEFLEDWPGQVECFNDDGLVPASKAIAAVRKITIEQLRKQETAEQQLSANRSSFESVSATSTQPLPTTIYFKCVPFHGLGERNFVLRLGVLTGEKDARISLRVVNQEQHNEEMAAELEALVRSAIGEHMPVLCGTYKPTA